MIEITDKITKQRIDMYLNHAAESIVAKDYATFHAMLLLAYREAKLKQRKTRWIH